MMMEMQATVDATRRLAESLRRGTDAAIATVP
jgi:hypothetical protein